MQSIRGTALFLILIAVALFAALAYAVTQSGRGGGTIAKEQASLDATQIVQAMAVVQVGVQRMIITGTPADRLQAGDPPDQQYPGAGLDNGWPTFCTTGEDCLFAPAGGGVSLPHLPKRAFVLGGNPSWFAVQTAFTPPPNGYQGWHFNGIDGATAAGVSGFSVPGVGTAEKDELVAVYPLTREVCQAINKGLGIDAAFINEKIVALPDPSPREACSSVNPGNDTEFMFYEVFIAH